ncbi:hypothetical protein ES705_14811 [subsurface metagenome]
METVELTVAGREAKRKYQREYMRKYIRLHKEKIRQWEIKRWNKAGVEAEAEAAANA